MMNCLIEYSVGVIVEAVVLSMEPNRLRIAAAGFPDTLELTQSGQSWVTEDGQNVAVGFLQYGACEGAPIFSPALATAAGADLPCMTNG
jgi:hypothetical protein